MQQQYGFYSVGDLYNDATTKWFLSRQGWWFVLRPDGQLQLWTTGANSFTTIAAVDAQVWTDPYLLYGA